MPTIYKLTDQAMQTHRGYQWTLGEPRQTSGGGDLCSRGWLHAYTDPLLAVLLNPIHANFSDPRLFKGTGTRECREDNGLKVGYTSIVLTEEMPLPEVTLEQRVRFAILCALEVCTEPAFVTWTNGWLDGSDRTLKTAAEAAAARAAAAATAAAWAAEAAAARAAEAAAAAATAAATAAAAAAEDAAAAAAAAAAAWVENKPADLIAIARKAVNG